MSAAASAAPSSLPPCRLCRAPLRHTFVDLGMSPLCESYVPADRLDAMEPFYPLHVRVCERCLLVQLEEYVPPEDIFSEYAYFSSFSDSWVEHARAYTETVVERFRLGPDSQVVEVASNDGYLLRHFVERGIPSVGIEPAKNVAQVALDGGVPTLVEFFGTAVAGRLAEEGCRADLLVANNVLAHVPDLNDFVAGMKKLLAAEGVVTVEFPHLMQLVAKRQFDTIYHEHFSYFSLLSAQRVFEAHDLVVFDVEELPTHGGSLRLYVGHPGERWPVGPRVDDLLRREREAGLHSIDGYRGFTAEVQERKRALLELLITLKRRGATIAGYGAPGKGNTLLNYCGIGSDFIDYTVDRNPYKQGLFLPGTHIPVHHPDRIAATKPDYVVILPWNLEAEIREQLAYVREWGGRFIVPIPEAVVR